MKNVFLQAYLILLHVLKVPKTKVLTYIRQRTLAEGKKYNNERPLQTIWIKQESRFSVKWIRMISVCHIFHSMLNSTPRTLSLQLYPLIPYGQVDRLLRLMRMIWAAINLQACE